MTLQEGKAQWPLCNAVPLRQRQHLLQLSCAIWQTSCRLCDLLGMRALRKRMQASNHYQRQLNTILRATSSDEV